MGYHKLLILIAAFTLVQCKFNVSPYSADVPRLELNESNLNELKQRETGEGADFKVAIIADLHNYYREVEDLVKVINQEDEFRFTIVVGDVTNLGLKDEFEKTNSLLYHLRQPFLVAVGNHDLLTNGGIIFRRTYGALNFSFEYKNVLFVVFNNNNWEAGGTVPDMDWVNDALSSSTADVKILISHVSLQDPARFTDAEIANWAHIISTHGVDYVINGHDHNPTEWPFASAMRITVGAPSKRVFQELRFTPTGVTHQKRTF